MYYFNNSLRNSRRSAQSTKQNLAPKFTFFTLTKFSGDWSALHNINLIIRYCKFYILRLPIMLLESAGILSKYFDFIPVQHLLFASALNQFNYLILSS